MGINAIQGQMPSQITPPNQEISSIEMQKSAALPPAEGTPPRFQDVWKDIQQKYGEKPKTPREIKKSLGKDDFFRIMVTQMKNQDPTKPFDAEKMAQEIVQTLKSSAAQEHIST